MIGALSSIKPAWLFWVTQIEGLDYREIFSLVAKMVTVCTLLTVVTSKNWNVHQMGIHNAFLQGDFLEKVYMKLPPGFSNGHPGRACQLKKSLYGSRLLAIGLQNYLQLYNKVVFSNLVLIILSLPIRL